MGYNKLKKDGTDGARKATSKKSLKHPAGKQKKHPKRPRPSTAERGIPQASLPRMNDYFTAVAPVPNTVASNSTLLEHARARL